MSISASRTADPRQTRGRDLDAQSSQSDGAPGADEPVSTDLAALLDKEVAAITTGRQYPASTRPGSAATQPGHGSMPGAAPLAGELPSGDHATEGAGKTMSEEPKSAESEALAAGSVSSALAPVTRGASVAVRQSGAARQEQALAVPRRRIGAIVLETGGGPGAVAIAPATSPPKAGRSALGPGQPVEVSPMPSLRQLTDQQRAAILASIDPAWLKALHEQIDELYRLISTDYSSPPGNSEQMLKMLHDARQTLIENPEEYVNAEYRTREVKAMLERMRKSRHDGTRYGLGLLFYQVAWAALLLAGLVMAVPLTTALNRLGSMSGPTAADIFPFWSTMMWGGIGGVIGALYMLWWHVADRQDFDGQYSLWYLVQPVMGMVLGGIMFLVLAAGFLVVQVDLTDAQAATAARLLPYLVAVLAGFRQNWVYEQLERLMAVFTPAAAGPKA